MTTKLEQAARQALEALELMYEWLNAGTPSYVDESKEEAITALQEALAEPKCWCETCRPITLTDMRMVLCPDCGNKRCPHATDHRNACTGSNKPGQKGSSYEHCKPAEWEKLKDPQTLFVNLNRGFPAQLTHDHLLHLLNKTEQAERGEKDDA